ncbi:hypothetical protein [Neoroseomonas lacus]|uniref:Uncharacterized protein n=1 Tax=Neoroseomonas lacus TaxID=287609 RepID=A0A917NSQ8_9PROT|nr:hypothetical protein [Neoroseomonas lacus]GGJ25259.1 hypothetical protein GCM10011320_35790 [Neoroseomonas lacus]
MSIEADAVSALLGEAPWSIDAVVQAHFGDFRALDYLMRKHPGYAVQQGLADLRAAARLLREEVADFIAVAARLGHVLPRPETFRPAGRAMLEREEWEAKKCLHRVAVAASTLVDMSRVMRTNMAKAGTDITREYAAELARSLDKEQHDFVIALRNVASHARLLEPSWSIRYDASGTAVSIMLAAEDYIDPKRWTSGAIAYARTHTKVDLVALLASYERAAAEFNQWLIRHVEISRLPMLENYRECDAARRRVSARSHYGLLMQAAEQRRIDPYAVLPNFLSDEEIARVHAQRRGSAQQIDLIITLADKHDAVDDDLRHRITAIFAAHLAGEAGS